MIAPIVPAIRHRTLQFRWILTHGALFALGLCDAALLVWHCLEESNLVYVHIASLVLGAVYVLWIVRDYTSDVQGWKRYFILLDACVTVASIASLVSGYPESTLTALALHALRVTCRVMIEGVLLWQAVIPANVTAAQYKQAERLGISYVTPRVLVMPYPGSDSAVTADDVAAYLDRFHSGAYMVYNLCQGRKYPRATFHGRVNDSIRLPRGTAATVEQMIAFTDSVQSWMAKSPRHVVVVHSVHSTGRAGQMVAAWLLYKHRHANAADAERLFCTKRGIQSLDLLSQRRFLRYFESALRNPSLVTFPSRAVIVRRVRISSTGYAKAALLTGAETRHMADAVLQAPSSEFQFDIAVTGCFTVSLKSADERSVLSGTFDVRFLDQEGMLVLPSSDLSGYHVSSTPLFEIQLEYEPAATL